MEKGKAKDMRAARHSTKNRSHCWDLLACENFVSAKYLELLRLLAQNPQHFLFTCDFAALVEGKVEGKYD